MVLHCEYPAYMNRSPRDIPVAGVMQLPLGTQVTIRARANKDLVRVQIDDQAGDQPPVTSKIDMAAGAEGPQAFSFKLPALQADKVLSFTLLDTDGIHSRDPVRLALAAVPDEPPQLAVQLKGIGTAITPLARLPIVGDALYHGAALNLSRLKRRYILKPGETEKPLLARVALHAESLTIPHPVTGELVTIESPWTKDFAVAVKYLRRYASF